MSEIKAECMDCGLGYGEFPMDVVMPHSQWYEITMDGKGLLCAMCIVRRASKIPGATVCHLVVEVAPHPLGIRMEVNPDTKETKFYRDDVEVPDPYGSKPEFPPNQLLKEGDQP